MGVIVRTKYTRTYIEAPDLWSVILSKHANRCEAPAEITKDGTGELLALLVYERDAYWWDIKDPGLEVLGEPWS